MGKLKKMMISAVTLVMGFSLAVPIVSYAFPMERTVEGKGKWVLISEDWKTSDEPVYEVLNQKSYYEDGKLKSISTKNSISNYIINVTTVQYDTKGVVTAIVEEQKTGADLKDKTVYSVKNGKIVSGKTTGKTISSNTLVDFNSDIVYVYDSKGQYVKEIKTTATSGKTIKKYLSIYTVVTDGDKKKYTYKTCDNVNDDFSLPKDPHYYIQSSKDIGFNLATTYEKTVNEPWYYSDFGEDKEGETYQIDYDKDGKLKQCLSISETSNGQANATSFHDWTYDENGNPVSAQFYSGTYNKELGRLYPSTEGDYTLTWQFFAEKKNNPDKNNDSKKNTNKLGYQAVIKGKTYKVTKTVTDKNKVGEVSIVSIDRKATSVSVPNTVVISGKKYNVTTIAANAFKNNKRIKSVVIGKNIKKIGKNAFYGCKNLKKITIKTTKLTKKRVGKNAFAGINKKAKAKVPRKKLKAYKLILKKCGMNKKTQKISK